MSSERIHCIVAEILKPADIDFVPAKKGYWVRQVDSDITRVIALDTLKGGAYGLSYGLSLSYVPYPYFPSLRWHRTLKSKSLDLREQPQLYWNECERPVDPDAYIASGLLGEKCFHDEFEEVWAFCAPRILEWFESTANFAGILAKCAEHLKRNKLEIKYVPDARLVRAFTFARIGRQNDAKTEVDIFLEEQHEEEPARANLYKALGRVAPEVWPNS